MYMYIHCTYSELSGGAECEGEIHLDGKVLPVSFGKQRRKEGSNNNPNVATRPHCGFKGK